MTKNPVINALSASLYIVTIVSLISYFMDNSIEETIFVPMFMLSLLTLSVAFMGFVFFYRPFQMYLDGERVEAINLFLRTLAVFTFTTLIILALLFFSQV